MALADVTAALAQYNANIPWVGDVTKATAALEAVQFLLMNRPREIETNNRSIEYESLLEERRALQSFLKTSSSAVNRAKFTRGRALL
jgi:hypothetical protein